MAGKSTKNHVVGNHLAKMLERIIIQKPMMVKAAPEKILKACVAIFFESLADISHQQVAIIRKHLMILAMLSTRVSSKRRFCTEFEVTGSLAKKLGFGAVEEEKGEGRRPQRLRILAPNLVKRIFSGSVRR